MEEPLPIDPPTTKEERTWAMAAHLSAFLGHFFPFGGNIIGPLIVWVMKKDQFPLVDDQGKESINAQISVTIYLLIAGVLVWALIGFVLLPVIYVVAVILVIIAAIRANEGKAYRYPFIIRLVK